MIEIDHQFANMSRLILPVLPLILKTIDDEITDLAGRPEEEDAQPHERSAAADAKGQTR